MHQADAAPTARPIDKAPAGCGVIWPPLATLLSASEPQRTTTTYSKQAIANVKRVKVTKAATQLKTRLEVPENTFNNMGGNIIDLTRNAPDVIRRRRARAPGSDALQQHSVKEGVGCTRIVEQAFGRLKGIFCIYKQPFQQGTPEYMVMIIVETLVLHNWLIDLKHKVNKKTQARWLRKAWRRATNDGVVRRMMFTFRSM
ncbi:uncharacterized protein PITG_17418 [Phytophthora infestans T30-4]|uniref:DDE Tnp4 domain-containing protein n=1 Tax=Phytophthora infestans (strain T30-4) TaxID=403677 RepID=D0NW11_PHYIT|nr:uncharacterized protein PITG_17418 [Phytophthora infestans T30-4]EEY66847.1 hypothetical protein PITG_17418 [Phytophthora infestans T30-4]|eukprot:XP_002896734.1 hypothetical protein PITG_17418 [Phytophthora infestans T30-4]